MKTYKKWFILIFISTFFFVHCSNLKQANTQTPKWLNTEAQKLYSQFDLVYNSDSSFVLVYSDNKTESIPNYKIQFSVFNIDKQTLVFSNELDNAKLKWISKHEIEAIVKLGFVDKKTNSSTKTLIFNVLENNN